MKKDDILNLEKRWMYFKDKYAADAFQQISVPVIYAPAIEDAEHITTELSDFIFEKNILQQVTPRHPKFLLHSIAYTPQNEKSFLGIQTLYNRIRKAGGYYGSYRGVILTDVTEWQGHFNEKFFDIILSYLSDRRMEGLIPFFFMKFRDYSAETRILDAAITSFFRSDRIVLETADLHDCMLSNLTQAGISVDRSTSCYIEGFIHKASGSEMFHGTDSIHQICEEIIQRYNASHDKAEVLDGPLLKEMLSSTGYLGLFKDKEKRSIGFR